MIIYVDFLINLSYDRELLPQKKYIKLSEKLDDIILYTQNNTNQCKYIVKVLFDYLTICGRLS